MADPQPESERLLSNARDANPVLNSDDDHNHLTDDEGSDGSVDFEQREHDHQLLAEEDEREQLLTGRSKTRGLGRLFSAGVDQNNPRPPKRPGRKMRRQKLRGRGDEAGELMYEMEEGGGSAASDDSRGSSEVDEKRLRMVQGQKASRRKRAFTKLAIWGGVLVLFLVLVFGAYRASSGSSEAPLKFNNGTVNFAATTILISLDGFRADFLNRGLTPTLNAFVQDGVSPKFMNPSFPSLTFPNHYTLATGLYPEAHGIVGNTFWDPMFKEEFYYTHPAHSMQPKWWGGEPIWETAERQGMRSAIHMWPGSEAHIGGVEPAYVDKFNGSEQLSVKVRRILQLLDLPGPDMPTALANSPRPQLIAAYVPNVDSDGHKYGPNSTEIRTTIQQVDTMLGDLFHGLEQRNLTKIVNVIVVSDHGMATTSVDRLIQLDDLVDPGLLEHVDGWPLYGLRPKNPADLEGMHRQILAKTKDNPNVEVYLRDKDMPERYHFTQNDRIAPLWLVPKAGWAITKREDFDIEQAKKDGVEYSPRGLHGYDHEHPLMRAIFVARGPAFPHQPGSRVDPFQNIEVYNIVCDSLGLEPRPNNGTIRLPLKPVGLHGDPTVEHETPEDPPTSSSPAKVESMPWSTDATWTALTESGSPTSVQAVTPTGPSIVLSQSSNPPEAGATLTSAGRPSSHTGVPEPGSPEGGASKEKDFWKWLLDKIDDAKHWASEVMDKVGVHKEQPPADPAA